MCINVTFTDLAMSRKKLNLYFKDNKRLSLRPRNIYLALAKKMSFFVLFFRNSIASRFPSSHMQSMKLFGGNYRVYK